VTFIRSSSSSTASPTTSTAYRVEACPAGIVTRWERDAKSAGDTAVPGDVATSMLMSTPVGALSETVNCSCDPEPVPSTTDVSATENDGARHAPKSQLPWLALVPLAQATNCDRVALPVGSQPVKPSRSTV
jgi:hypothetical protein